MEKKYKVINQLGNKGKEGRTYLVQDKMGFQYAAKQFRKNKSVEKLKNELELQKKCSDNGISPKVIDYNFTEKYIVMEKMDCHLYDYMMQKGFLPEGYQKQIVDLLKKLDKIGVFQGDPNILNYMLKGSNIYIIDFGLAEHINSNLKKKVKSMNPNSELGLLSFILKLKDNGFKKNSYNILVKHISKATKTAFKL